MKVINKKIYIEFSEMVATGAVSASYLSKAKSTGAKCWQFINDATDARKVLIEFDSLKPEYKKAIEARYGNPFDYCAKQPIKQMVQKDTKAEEFFMAYRYDGHKCLPIEHVQKYSEAAAWLNMLASAYQDKKAIKKLAGSLDTFWLAVCDLIKTEKIDLPHSFKRLKATLDKYIETGYASLIDWRFGNNLAAKVSDDFTQSLLIELLSNYNQHDDTVIAGIYNANVTSKGYEPISASTVGKWKRDNYYQIQGAREGNSAWYNTYGQVISRKRPSAPLLLIGADDNDLDLYFKEETPKGINYYFRYKLIVVMDAHNDYILGWAYGETVTKEVIKAAFLDAMYHIKELTGAWYLPHQLQTDRWGNGALEDFYKSIATYTPATAKVARAKYIEQAFGTTWHQSLKMNPNYAGTNITSAGRINADALAINKKSFPWKDEAPAYIEQHVHRLRNLIDAKTNLTRQQTWLQNFNNSELSQERRIGDARMLTLFGQQHNFTNTITNAGLQVSIGGAKITYEIPAELYLQNVGKKVQVFYDMYDTSRILVTDNNTLRFIAHEAVPMPSALADYAPGDRARLNHLLQVKRNHVETIANAKQNRQDALQRAGIDSQSLLQAGVLIKEAKQGAEMIYQQTTYGQPSNSGTYNALDQM